MQWIFHIANIQIAQARLYNTAATVMDWNAGPTACEADLIPLHHVPVIVVRINLVPDGIIIGVFALFNHGFFACSMCYLSCGNHYEHMQRRGNKQSFQCSWRELDSWLAHCLL